MADELPIIPLIQIPDKKLDKARKSFERKKKQEEKQKERNKKSTAKKKSSGGGGGKDPLAFLQTTNDWLEDVPVRISTAYENFIGDGENLAQSKVDKFCAWLAWKVNIAIERKRQKILEILHGQYESTAVGKVMKMATTIQSFVSDPLGTIGDFAGGIFGPVIDTFKWIGKLISEVIRLASNLGSIMSALPPSPPNPRINYDKFKLQIKSISLGEVIGGADSLPPPEVMFPEPPKPFTKDTFKDGFEKTSAALKSAKKKYFPSEEDKKTLEALNTPETSAYKVVKKEEEADVENYWEREKKRLS